MQPLTRWTSCVTEDFRRSKFESVLRDLHLSAEKISHLTAVLEEQIILANSRNLEIRRSSDLSWEISYVRNLLDGTENGDFVGLDLGGTHFRIVGVHFANGHVVDTTIKYYDLTEEHYTGPCANVFNYMAKSLISFFMEEKLHPPVGHFIPIGFTFSYSVQQTSLKNSTLIVWAKNFTCPDGIGEDPCVMLEAALKRNGGLPVPGEILARINDTTAAMLSGNYLDHSCRIGLILGTGSNACLVERLENVGNWNGDYEDPKQVLINTDWGRIGDNGCADFMRTKYEKDVDKYSKYPGKYTFEKSFAGMFLGELTRLVLVELVDEHVLFGGHAPGKLMDRWQFTSSYVTSIESLEYDGHDIQNTKAILEDVLDPEGQITDEDAAIIRSVCSFLCDRGACIVATGLSVLLKRINLPEVAIAVDGSLYEHDERFHIYMEEYLKHLVPDIKVKFVMAKDGSGQGGAFAAAVALKEILAKRQ